ncbi:hypothetical protein VNI00_015403 [Paramarasmius palmivorus]|uniref:Uncharacterized protein n=1 Tax=Paramarasmius palmivorus TaxID=297713 RepID=A0AAW0BKN8_9AGAR
MSFFQGSSNLVIEQSQFNNVAGAQHNVYHGNVVQYVNQGKRGLSIWDEYMRVPTGKVYIRKTFGTMNASGYDQKARRWRKEKNVKCTLNIARIDGSDFLHIGYSGPNAPKAFLKDFQRFSSVKNIESVQLFGYNDHPGLQALVFYDELVPVSHIWERNGFSSVLYTYFSYQCGIAQNMENVSLCELWVDSSGALRKGLYVEDSWHINNAVVTLNSTCDDHSSNFLAPQTYDSSVVLEYLIKFLSIPDLLRGLAECRRVAIQWVDDEDILWMLTTLPGTIYHRFSRQVLLREQSAGEGCYNVLLDGIGILEAMRESRVDMPSGCVRHAFRFTLTPSNIAAMRSFDLCCALPRDNSSYAGSWLLLANLSFVLHEIEEDQWRDYAIFDGFWLEFLLTSKGCQRPELSQSNRPFYLFIRPIPRPSDDKAQWNAWIKGTKYFWSFEPLGVEEIPEHMHHALGLPSFEVEIEVRHIWWEHDVYDAVRKLLRSQGSHIPAPNSANSGSYYSRSEIVGQPNEACFAEMELANEAESELMDIDDITKAIDDLDMDGSFIRPSTWVDVMDID